MLDVSIPRVYQLVSAGTLAVKIQGLTRMVSRRSVLLWKDSPNREKFSRKRSEISADFSEEPSLFEQSTSPLGEDEEWSGLQPVTLSPAAQRLHGGTLRGVREARLEAERLRGGL